MVTDLVADLVVGSGVMKQHHVLQMPWSSYATILQFQAGAFVSLMEVGLAWSKQDQWCCFLAVVALVAFMFDACLINLNLNFQTMAFQF